MGVESFRRSHWVVIGLAAGMMLGAARLVWRDDDLARGTTAILSQTVFERELLQHAPDGAPRLDRLLVYPPDRDGRTWVTGERFVPSLSAQAAAGNAVPGLEYEPFRFPAKVPYRPLTVAGPGGAEATVADYLDSVKARHPNAGFTYRRAWWATGIGMMGLWTAGGALAIGGVWPVVLNLLIGAGFGRPAKGPDYDLDRFKSESAPVRPENDGVGTKRHLEELEQELIEHLAEAPASVPVAAPSSPVAAAPPPPTLDTRPPELPPITPDGADLKEFGGEFYPTTFWGPTNHDDSDDASTPPREPRE